MAYDEHLAYRVGAYLDRLHVTFTTRKMFGGVCFFVNDKMLCGVMKNRLLVRIDPAEESGALLRPGASLMDVSGRSMRGFLMIDEDGCDLERDLEDWINRCLEFNPRAKASKKKP